jgi:hypothetical protein
MQKYCTLVLLLIALSACTPASNNYAKLSDGYNAQMATDTAHQLVAFYPPASTHFTLSEASKDTFGLTLQKSLRESGYGIQESQGLGDWLPRTVPAANEHSKILIPAPKPSLSKDALNSDDPNMDSSDDLSQPQPIKSNAPVSTSVNSLALSYIVDAVGSDLYRVSVKIGTQIMSRVYSISGSRVVAAGAWARKE